MESICEHPHPIDLFPVAWFIVFPVGGSAFWQSLYRQQPLLGGTNFESATAQESCRAVETKVRSRVDAIDLKKTKTSL